MTQEEIKAKIIKVLEDNASTFDSDYYHNRWAYVADTNFEEVAEEIINLINELSKKPSN